MNDPETNSAQANASGEPEEESYDFPLPPATFHFLVLRQVTEAQVHLGLIHFGEEKDPPKPNLHAARHAIDLLAVLEEKTRGNLTLEEKRLLENSLTELRFRYVQAATAPAQAE